MEITINDRRKIYSIQKEFNKEFPYLKIEFFSKPSKAGGAASRKLIKTNSKSIAECRTIHNNGKLEVTPQMTVNELEQHLMDEYGLSVQVFRKSGTVWLETTVTDGWTLEEQNKQGEELSRKVKVSD